MLNESSKAIGFIYTAFLDVILIEQRSDGANVRNINELATTGRLKLT